MGGTIHVVQVDETVLFSCGKIRCPSVVDDEFKDTLWIVGMVDVEEPTNFFCKSCQR